MNDLQHIKSQAQQLLETIEAISCTGDRELLFQQLTKDALDILQMAIDLERRNTSLRISRAEYHKKESIVDPLPIQEEDPIVSPTDTEKEKKSISKIPLDALLSLNDRFLFRRELFNGDDQLMNSTLSDIQQLDSFANAIHALQSFAWTKDDPAVELFYSTIERYYEQ